MDKVKYMELALREAREAFLEDEVPVGAIIVYKDKVIASGHNHKEKMQSALFHAEIEVIKQACDYLDTWHLEECMMYVTLEPCLMCTGAIINSRIKEVIYATKDPKGGALNSCIELKNIKGLNHYPEIDSGYLQEEAAYLLRKFFASKRKK